MRPLTFVLLALAAPASTTAQASSEPVVVDFQQSATTQRTPTLALFALGAIGSVAGGYGGGWLGYSLDRARHVPSEDPGLMGALLGALTGSVVGTTLMVHFADRGRGGAGGPLGGAVLGTVVGLVFAVAADDGDLVVPAIVVAQASLATTFASRGGRRGGR